MRKVGVHFDEKDPHYVSSKVPILRETEKGRISFPWSLQSLIQASVIRYTHKQNTFSNPNKNSSINPLALNV